MKRLRKKVDGNEVNGLMWTTSMGEEKGEKARCGEDGRWVGRLPYVCKWEHQRDGDDLVGGRWERERGEGKKQDWEGSKIRRTEKMGEGKEEDGQAQREREKARGGSSRMAMQQAQRRDAGCCDSLFAPRPSKKPPALTTHLAHTAPLSSQCLQGRAEHLGMEKS